MNLDSEIVQIFEDSFQLSGFDILANRFRVKPEGIIIEDSYNNILFPIPEPRIDNNKANLPLVMDQFRSRYVNNTDLSILPWHFCIEFIEKDYIIYNSRPIDMMYPFTSDEIKNKVKNLSDDNLKILDNIEVKNTIHVMIIGDTSRDVYTKKFYSKLSSFIIKPMGRHCGFSPIINQNVFLLNTGSRLNHNLIIF